MILARAPFRIPLGGGGTDLPSYASRHGGALVSLAIDRYAYVTLRRRLLDRRIRVLGDEPELVDDPAALRHPLLREALRLLPVDAGLEVTMGGDVPGGTGLGTSGAFGVALLRALHALRGEATTPEALAEEAAHLEIDRLGLPVGKHDQYLAALGGVTCLEVARDGRVAARPARVDPAVAEALTARLLLFFTGTTRRAAEVLAEQDRKTTEEDAGVVEALHRIKAIGQEVLGALEAGDLPRLGRLQHDHWETKKRLSARVSDARIDGWYALARRCGATGGKIVGAGGGGFLVLYCEPAAQAALREAMGQEGLPELPYRLDRQGVRLLAGEGSGT